ncbi:MAG: type II toxin-antitoxin system RelE/ParE family toxin, partial [Methanotrichaceae archaeon]
MSFDVQLHRNVKKAIKDLPKSHQEQFVQLVDILKEDPVPFRKFDLVRIRGHIDIFRIRLGGFRLTYEVDEDNQCIKLLKLGG